MYVPPKKLEKTARKVCGGSKVVAIVLLFCLYSLVMLLFGFLVMIRNKGRRL